MIMDFVVAIVDRARAEDMLEVYRSHGLPIVLTMLGNGTEQSYIDTMRNTGTTWILVIMLAGTILAAAVSAFIGCKMMKKQFEKAGITK